MTGKSDRFIAAMYVVGFGWTGSGPVAATLVTDDYLQEEDSPAEEDDFDALMATSSFGSEQARAIREQTPPAAREHARRVLDGKEKCAPADGDVDDAVGGLVYGLAHGVVPGPTVLILAGSALTPADLLTAVSGPQVASKLVILTACQTSALWPDHRARLLQALIDHDAFASLRHDVAWKIIDLTFDVPRPPRVLRECAALAVEQVDFSAIAYTWLASNRDKAAARSSEPCLSYLDMSGVHRDVHLQQEMAPELPGGLVPRETGPMRRGVPIRAVGDRVGQGKPAPDSAPPRAALTAGPTRPAIAAQADTPAKTRHSPRRVRANTRRLPPKPRAARRGPSPIAAGIAVAVAVIAIIIGGPHPGFGRFPQPRLAAAAAGFQVGSATAIQISAAAVQFNSDSATLESEAAAVLRPIAQQAQSGRLVLSITGYASPIGSTAADDFTLSAQRVNVVRDWFVVHGVPAAQITQIHGGGAAAGTYSNASCVEEDKPNEATCPELRSVFIVLSSTMGNP